MFLVKRSVISSGLLAVCAATQHSDSTAFCTQAAHLRVAASAKALAVTVAVCGRDRYGGLHSKG